MSLIRTQQKQMGKLIKEERFSKGLPYVYLEGNWLMEQYEGCKPRKVRFIKSPRSSN